MIGRPGDCRGGLADRLLPGPTSTPSTSAAWAPPRPTTRSSMTTCIRSGPSRRAAAPFHKVALICPAATTADVDLHAELFGTAIGEPQRGEAGTHPKSRRKTA